MSSIGSGLAASVAALGTAERAAVTKKATEKRDEHQVRKQIQDRYASDTADVEAVTAVVETQQDDESPADDRREKKPDVHAQVKEPGERPRASIDIQA